MLMTKKEERIFEKIQESIFVECSIQCQKCEKIVREYNTDEYYFAEMLINKGWTFKRDRILCDECSGKMEMPKFVKLNNTALRLIGNEYYRDGGQWSVGYKIIDGVLLSWAWSMGDPQLHKKPLIKITEDEWRKDNGQYATTDV